MSSNNLDHLKDLINLQERMNQIFKEVIPLPPQIDSNNTWSPLVDIYELGNEIVIKVELPEVEQEKIQVNIEGEELTVTGERNLPQSVEPEKYYRKERFYGTFSRHFTLPYNIDQENINADYKNGVLTITMPKLTPKVAKQITVKVS
jgi:HSP20 family protein